MKFSIVTVCYNAETNIRATIQSVISQSYNNREYIIIDGKSTDGTLNIINEFNTEISTLISESDNGIYDAMNKGIRIATGDYVIFMNAGDTFADENVLNCVAKSLDSSIDVIYGDNFLTFKEKKLYHKARYFNDNDINLPFNHQSTFVKTQLAKDIPFDLKYRIAGDYYFFYTLHKLGKVFKYIPIPIANYSMDGMSQHHIIKTFQEVREIRKCSIYKYKVDLLKLKLRLAIRKLTPNKVVNLFRTLKYNI